MEMSRLLFFTFVIAFVVVYNFTHSNHEIFGSEINPKRIAPFVVLSYVSLSLPYLISGYMGAISNVDGALGVSPSLHILLNSDVNISLYDLTLIFCPNK